MEGADTHKMIAVLLSPVKHRSSGPYHRAIPQRVAAAEHGSVLFRTPQAVGKQVQRSGAFGDLK